METCIEMANEVQSKKIFKVVGLLRIFFITMGFFFVLSTLLTMNRQAPRIFADEKGKLDIEIQLIDQEILELQTVKQSYEAKAVRAERLAETKQFDTKYNMETRRLYQLAQQNRDIADQIQKDIDKLEAKKQELLSKK